MKTNKIAAATLMTMLLASFAVGDALAAPQRTKPQPTKPQQRVIIPNEIKAIMQEGLATKQGRQDIHFSIFHHIYLPTAVKEDLYGIFFFKAKNSDLGFGKPMPAAPRDPKQKLPPAPAVPSDMLQTRLHVFLQFLQKDSMGGTKIFNEHYMPLELLEPIATFSPDKVDWFSFGQAFHHGDFILVMAIASQDLKIVGVNYYDFSLPGPEAYQDKLILTPVVFVRDFQQMQAPEQRISIHKGTFTYSIIQITPNIEYEVLPGDSVEVMFSILGGETKPVEGQLQPKYDLEVAYEVHDAEHKPVIRWQNQTYEIPFIMQQLPLQQTVVIKDDKGERQEKRNLAAGTYELVIKVNDKISGHTAESKTSFVVK